MIGKSNKKAKWMAIIAGMLLLISGINGVGFVEAVGKFVVTYLSNNEGVILTFRILLLIASFGGLSVILGGILIGKNKTLLGVLFVKVGSGVGVIGLIAHVFLAAYSRNLTIASFFSIGTIGVILSVIAPFYAKK